MRKIYAYENYVIAVNLRVYTLRLTNTKLMKL